LTTKPLPKKLNPDAIVEALLEVRFKTSILAELVSGRLSDSPAWKGLAPQRLVAADVPEVIRRTDPNLLYQPTVELRQSDGQRIIRIGPQVLSYHRLAPYVGWQNFRKELFETIGELFARIGDARVTRLGLRYINALSRNHGIARISDLDMTVTVDSAPLTERINLNFMTIAGENIATTVRIASPDFVQGKLPEGSAVIVDIDVFTKEGVDTAERATVQEWTERAHTEAKHAFFSLLTLRTISKLEGGNQ
jgi:uncharacterized protein (TIGR04255 family)